MEQKEVINQKFRNLENNQLFSDVLFKIGTPATVYYSHRLVLSLTSQFFADIFYSNEQNLTVPRTIEITIENFPTEIFEVFLKYVYTNTLPALSAIIDLNSKKNYINQEEEEEEEEEKKQKDKETEKENKNQQKQIEKEIEETEEKEKEKSSLGEISANNDQKIEFLKQLFRISNEFLVHPIFDFYLRANPKISFIVLQLLQSKDKSNQQEKIKIDITPPNSKMKEKPSKNKSKTDPNPKSNLITQKYYENLTQHSYKMLYKKCFFNDLPITIIRMILQNKISKVKEIILFRRLFERATHQCELQKIEQNAENIKKNLGDLINFINLNTFNLNELKEISKTNIFDDKIILELVFEKTTAIYSAYPRMEIEDQIIESPKKENLIQRTKKNVSEQENKSHDDGSDQKSKNQNNFDYIKPIIRKENAVHIISLNNNPKMVLQEQENYKNLNHSPKNTTDPNMEKNNGMVQEINNKEKKIEKESNKKNKKKKHRHKHHHRSEKKNKYGSGKKKHKSKKKYKKYKKKKKKKKKKEKEKEKEKKREGKKICGRGKEKEKEKEKDKKNIGNKNKNFSKKKIIVKINTKRTTNNLAKENQIVSKNVQEKGQVRGKVKENKIENESGEKSNQKERKERENGGGKDKKSEEKFFKNIDDFDFEDDDDDFDFEGVYPGSNRIKEKLSLKNINENEKSKKKENCNDEKKQKNEKKKSNNQISNPEDNHNSFNFVNIENKNDGDEEEDDNNDDDDDDDDDDGDGVEEENDDDEDESYKDDEINEGNVNDVDSQNKMNIDNSEIKKINNMSNTKRYQKSKKELIIIDDDNDIIKEKKGGEENNKEKRRGRGNEKGKEKGQGKENEIIPSKKRNKQNSNKPQFTKKILFLFADQKLQNMERLLSAMKFQNDNISITPYPISEKTPTLNYMKKFDGIFIYSYDNLKMPKIVGDRLAKFIQDGGSVVVCSCFLLVDDPEYIYEGLLDGEIISGDFLPIKPGRRICHNRGFLGTVLKKNHPIMRNVKSFDGGKYSLRIEALEVSKGSELIAKWSDDNVLIAVKHPNPLYGKIVVLNFFPISDQDTKDKYWLTSTDGHLLISNSIKFICNID
ncbi:lute isoform d [Anaeramoeba flamelloides]|uniref:Lute isoform d n=1 Tax=Anaeramoeba flamelloides TaxID=1746091 RepID=A0AAV7YCZ5_9EUKA|nr:lute isoform d [Anaeramoeba flamelloides]